MLGKGAGQPSRMGHREVEAPGRICKALKGSKRSSRQAGLLPDLALDHPHPLVYKADFKPINTETSPRGLTFVSETGHLESF